jgi:hypothetical protein
MKKLIILITLASLMFFVIKANSSIQEVSQLKIGDRIVAGPYNITVYGITYGLRIRLEITKDNLVLPSIEIGSNDVGREFFIDNGVINFTVVDVFMGYETEKSWVSLNMSFDGSIQVLRATPQEQKGNISERVCVPGEKRCNNNRLEKCSSTGEKWELIETCEYGCNSTTLGCNLISKEEKCKSCPYPTEWSECINGTQKRINYRCGAETQFKCEGYEEERKCKEIPYSLIGVGISVSCLVGLVFLIFSERLVRFMKKIK